MPARQCGAAAPLAALSLCVFGCGGANPGATQAPPGVDAPAGVAPGPNPPAPDAPTPRKIVYTASLEVIVKNLDEAGAFAAEVIERNKGYVAKSEVVGDAGARRTATYTIRVPADRYQQAVRELAALGNTIRNAADSQDVTEEFFDLQSRLKNLRAEEEALNKLMREKAGSLEDVLKIRTQLAEVRGNIEKGEGRAKYLATMIALSTIHLTLREVKDYVLPTAPTFVSEVADTFHSSIHALTELARGLSLCAVGLAPWLPVFLAAGIALRRIGRWVFARPAVAKRVEAVEVVMPVSAGPTS